MNNLNIFDLQKLNSMTKYPSILTYHELGDKGMLQESLCEGKSFEGNEVIITEKVDGTNGRIIIYNGDYMIGSREDILYAKSDRIINPALGIVETLKPFAEKLANNLESDNSIRIVFSEVYGGNVTAASKQYTSTKEWSFRTFDICIIDPETIEKVIGMDRDKIALWRDNGGQHFVSEKVIESFANMYSIKRVPYLSIIDGSDLPVTLTKTYEFLKFFENSKATIDSESGRAEGIVVRTKDRSLIRKIRFEDYERTKKRGGF